MPNTAADPPTAEAKLDDLRSWRSRLGDTARIGLFGPWLRVAGTAGAELHERGEDLLGDSQAAEVALAVDHGHGRVGHHGLRSLRRKVQHTMAGAAVERQLGREGAGPAFQKNDISSRNTQ